MWVCLLHFVEPYRTLIGRPSAAGTWSEGKPRCTRSGANFSSAPWEFCSVESSRRVTSRCSPHKIWRIWFWMRCHFDPFGSVWAISFDTSKGSLRSGFSTLSTVQTWPRPRPFILHFSKTWNRSQWYNFLFPVAYAGGTGPWKKHGHGLRSDTAAACFAFPTGTEGTTRILFVGNLKHLVGFCKCRECNEPGGGKCRYRRIMQREKERDVASTHVYVYMFLPADRKPCS